MTETHELAVMCDTFHPLRLTKLAQELDDGKYWHSWFEDPGAGRERRRGSRRRHVPFLTLHRDDQRAAPLARAVGADLLEPVQEPTVTRRIRIAIGVAGSSDRAHGAHDLAGEKDAMPDWPAVDVEAERADLLRGAPAGARPLARVRWPENEAKVTADGTLGSP